ncbi:MULTISPECIES: LPS export ABC transporter permease LptG [Rhodomicrobium]|uniref:LPS export ABC transporter permease LptG n=1 Tax=Rhodomicrobium TaxID=1068 RepID=UPI000B4BDCE2|nr:MULTISPECIES: LPS export ABC transporter permease LptG [Rhodomicrobium]
MNAVNTLGRYFATRLFVMILVVYGVCIMLVFFIDFVEMMREASKVEVSAGEVVFLTLLRLPGFAELMIPFAVLIGSIGAFLMLSRSSELVIVRASGISIWQFLQPAMLLAALVGVFASTVYNPLAAKAKLASEQIFATSFAAKGGGQSKNGTSSWIRQDGPDGQSIIYARATANRGTLLAGLTLLQFDLNKKFIERIEADKANLRPGYWELENANVSSSGNAPQHYNRYLVSTFLDASQVTESVDTVEGVDFWELPKFIEFAKKAGVDTTAYSLYYQQLLARPLLMVAMVLLAATCALKPFRFGKIQTMVIAGLSGGFGFFILVELSRKLGMSGYITVGVAAWAPIVIASLLAVTVLLHQEDG